MCSDALNEPHALTVILADAAESNYARTVNFLKGEVPVEARRAQRLMETSQNSIQKMQEDIQYRNGVSSRMRRENAVVAMLAWQEHGRTLSEINTRSLHPLVS